MRMHKRCPSMDTSLRSQRNRVLCCGQLEREGSLPETEEMLVCVKCFEV